MWWRQTWESVFLKSTGHKFFSQFREEEKAALWPSRYRSSTRPNGITVRREQLHKWLLLLRPAHCKEDDRCIERGLSDFPCLFDHVLMEWSPLARTLMSSESIQLRNQKTGKGSPRLGVLHTHFCLRVKSCIHLYDKVNLSIKKRNVLLLKKYFMHVWKAFVAAGTHTFLIRTWHRNESKALTVRASDQ